MDRLLADRSAVNPELNLSANTEAIWRAWSAQAAPLAYWTYRRLLNRQDVWGKYWVEAGKVQRVTRPTGDKRGKALLRVEYVQQHYRAGRTEDILGLHTTSRINTSVAGAVDIDRHSDDDPVTPEQTLAAALAWYSLGVRLGFQPLLTSSNGRGGYHLRFLFTNVPKTPLVYAYLRWLVRDHREYGLDREPETFPRQPRLDAQTPYGNWLRLPGRHHSRPYWSEVWDGERWLAGEPAVAYILTLTGDSPALIPDKVLDYSPPTPTTPPTPIPAPQPVVARPVTVSEDRVIRAARKYLSKVPGAIVTKGGDSWTFHAACILMEKFALTIEQATPLILEWNDKCDPPWDWPKLKRKLEQAEAKATNRGEYLHRLERGEI